MTARGKLREELTRRFVPLLRQRGFDGPERIAGNALLHDFRRAADAGVHVLSIQFDKYQRPRCILNVRIEPPGGFDALFRSGGTMVRGWVKSRRGSSSANWFRADRPWWQRLFGVTSTREQEAVSEVVATLDEIDRWWQTQQPSLHISTHTLDYRRRELRRKYRLLSSGLGWMVGLIWAVSAVAFMYLTRLALGLPMEAGPIGEQLLAFVVWIGLMLVGIPAIYYCCTIFVRGALGLVMALAGKATTQEAKAYAFHAKYPEYWFQNHDA